MRFHLFGNRLIAFVVALFVCPSASAQSMVDPVDLLDGTYLDVTAPTYVDVQLTQSQNPIGILDPDLENPDVSQRPSGSSDIRGFANEFSPNLTTSENRLRIARDDAYAQYIALCVSRAFLGLPVPGILHEDFGESKWLWRNPDKIQIVAVYSIWLDDPLEVIVLEPEPDPISTPAPQQE